MQSPITSVVVFTSGDALNSVIVRTPCYLLHAMPHTILTANIVLRLITRGWRR
jgi:uncharacterized MnhB-related membrane protein